MDENSLAQNDEGPISVAQVTAFQDPHTNLIIPTQTPVSYQIFPQGDQISIIWHTMTGKTFIMMPKDAAKTLAKQLLELAGGVILP